ncbi:hypothetical protein GIB67_009497 [Kingdonia uniflora]|uniref:WD repeat and HMG-box DNA-binding protein 1 n=1 Tax=Kingdonia uniflora TaxID=39325 RepID=A0A7J7NVZ7_9MAGN|nr:hypothetical protein GIB67_009497 [Kingdonia uniflora]
MKIRSLKLKEAHKSNNGVKSFCSIIWDLESQHLVTSSSSDSSISIHDVLLSSAPPKILRNHKDGVTALALSPNSTCLASGSIDHSVKLYKFPGGEFQTNITRFTLPIRSLCFNKSGSMLAAAGDDDGIKLINTVDDSIVRVLKGHKGPVTAIAFDPKSEYLASIDSNGSVIFWELSSGKSLHNLKGIAPASASDNSVLNVLSWSPDGDLLAAPGLKNDVVMYDRDTAEKLFTLKGEHVEPVCYLCWSPNGKYMATSGLDRQILIWDVDQRQDIERQKFDDKICCMAWKPNGNNLAVIDVMGKFGLWESPVPSSMKSPTDGAPSQKSKTNGLLLFDEDELEPSISGSLGDAREESLDNSEPVSRKRLHKRSKYDRMLDEDSDDELHWLRKAEPRRKVSHTHKESLDDVGEEIQSVMKPERTKMQECFQPGSTPVQAGKRRFLCYNMIGCITTMEHEGYSHIEVDFHDTGKGPRVPSRTDYFGFTMAALNENGSVFANLCKGDQNMSTLMYCPFNSWENNSEWSMRFESEEVKVVALGTGWVAAITSLNYLRIFTGGGLQKYILSIDGPVVTAAGLKDELAIVTHASHSLPTNDQMLEFEVFNISNKTQTLRGHLPLTPGSNLSWFGFSEEGQLSSYDSKGVLRVFSNEFGGKWLPLFSANKEKSDERYWAVGLDASKLFCVVCKSPDAFPLVSPKPILTILTLSFPLASSDLGADKLENEFILSNLHLSQTQKRIEEMSAVGKDTTLIDDEAFSMEMSLDRCILRLIAGCCNADKLVRATELVRLLSLEKSVKGAIKLVTGLKLPVLAERFNTILEERLLNETMEAMQCSNSTSNAILTNGVERHHGLTVSENEISEPAHILNPPKLLSPHFAKQDQAEAKKGGEKVQLKTTALEASLKVEANKVDHASIPFLKTSNNEVKANSSLVNCTNKTADNGIRKESANPFQSHRPTNPFAKTSNNQEKSSIFDSFKKANNGDTK